MRFSEIFANYFRKFETMYTYKNGPSKIFCLLQYLLGLFLNTLFNLLYRKPPATASTFQSI